jgi:peptidylprolyl isomerase
VLAAATPHRPEAPTRRDTLAAITAFTVTALTTLPAAAYPDDEEEERVFCDAACISDLATKPRTKTESGLEWQDIIVGDGAQPPVGFQVVAHYVASTPDGRVFSNSLTRKEGPYDFRVGAGQVIKGMDEGILSMRSGGVRRMYIPGELAFPKGLPASPGRARVPPSSPVVFDVQLVYVPGLD